VTQSVPTSLDRIAAWLSGQPRRLLISGEWVEARSGKIFPVYNPNDGSVIAQAAEGAIEAVADDMALIEALDTGKPLGAARSFDIRGAIEKLRYFSG